MDDGRIAYVDFGNVAELSSGNKQTLIDAVVHAVNEDYEEMARDFIKLVRLCPPPPPRSAYLSSPGPSIFTCPRAPYPTPFRPLPPAPPPFASASGKRKVCCPKRVGPDSAGASVHCRQ